MVEPIELDEPQFKGVQDFVDQAVINILAVHDALIASRVSQTFTANKQRAEDPPLRKGDLVYLSTEKLNLPKERARKLLPLFIGPYPVVTTHPETSNYTLELPLELVKWNIHPTLQLWLHIPNDDVRFPKREVRVFYDFGDDPNAEWFIDSIVGHKWSRNRLQLEVRWSLGDVTWEPLSRCNELVALDQYLALHGVTDPEDLPRRQSVP